PYPCSDPNVDKVRNTMRSRVPWRMSSLVCTEISLLWDFHMNNGRSPVECQHERTETSSPPLNPIKQGTGHARADAPHGSRRSDQRDSTRVTLSRESAASVVQSR